MPSTSRAISDRGLVNEEGVLPSPTPSGGIPKQIPLAGDGKRLSPVAETWGLLPGGHSDVPGGSWQMGSEMGGDYSLTAPCPKAGARLKPVPRVHHAYLPAPPAAQKGWGHRPLKAGGHSEPLLQPPIPPGPCPRGGAGIDEMGSGSSHGTLPHLPVAKGRVLVVGRKTMRMKRGGMKMRMLPLLPEPHGSPQHCSSDCWGCCPKWGGDGGLGAAGGCGAGSCYGNGWVRGSEAAATPSLTAMSRERGSGGAGDVRPPPPPPFPSKGLPEQGSAPTGAKGLLQLPAPPAPSLAAAACSTAAARWCWTPHTPLPISSFTGQATATRTPPQPLRPPTPLELLPAIVPLIPGWLFQHGARELRDNPGVCQAQARGYPLLIQLAVAVWCRGHITPLLGGTGARPCPCCCTLGWGSSGGGTRGLGSCLVPAPTGN